ncbi:MAG: 16S rRNA (guanine(527)-N(7))-methyltransferase RsmG [Gammaproteobacteria bacterium]
MENCREILVSGLRSLTINLEESQIDQLLKFIKLIEKWNKAYNLTAIRNKEDMISYHLLDSLAVLPYLNGSRIIDVGTGAGLPGIPLALACPGTEFTLLDSNAKKTRFVRQAVLELGIKNVAVYHGRSETYHPEVKFNTVITRAFAGLHDIIKFTAHLLAEDGILLAMKGLNAENELAQTSVDATVIPIIIPGIKGERSLVKIQSQALIEENCGKNNRRN